MLPCAYDCTRCLEGRGTLVLEWNESGTWMKGRESKITPYGRVGDNPGEWKKSYPVSGDNTGVVPTTIPLGRPSSWTTVAVKYRSDGVDRTGVTLSRTRIQSA